MAKPPDQRFHPEEIPFEEAVRRFVDFFDGVIIKDDDEIDLPRGRSVTPSTDKAPVNVAEATPKPTEPHYSQLDLLDQSLHRPHDSDGNTSGFASLPVPETPDSPVGDEPETIAAQYSQLNLLDRPPDAMHDRDRNHSDPASYASETPKGRVGDASKTMESRYSQLNLIDL
ncbi:MAG: hypothetical protein QNJ46_24895 [Leptolyngbyaceae cyanobacterium MO_188.B28]|nr:hypothetical protein [Leptolyngbyaceae cyanobacterium MO_188.B28]